MTVQQQGAVVVTTAARQPRAAGSGMPEAANGDSTEVNAFATGMSNKVLIAVSIPAAV